MRTQCLHTARRTNEQPTGWIDTATRPYFRLGIAALETVALSAGSSDAHLHAVYEELAHRKGPRARWLARDISVLLRERRAITPLS